MSSDTRSAFLFPQMGMDDNLKNLTGEENWSPGFIDYLFLAFNTSTTLCAYRRFGFMALGQNDDGASHNLAFRDRAFGGARRQYPVKHTTSSTRCQNSYRGTPSL